MHDPEDYYAVHISDVVDMLGAEKVTYCNTKNGIQLNIKWAPDRGWSCYTAPTLIGALNKVWTHKVMIEGLKTCLDS